MTIGSSSITLPLALLLLAKIVRAIDIERTYGIFGAIQFVDKATTATRLLEQCYTGFALNGCEDLNTTTSSFNKDYAFSSQFSDPIKRNQQYCLQCCSKPVLRLSGADETWNLSCPLNDLQRLSVSKGRRVYRFARRNTLEDEEIVECVMPNRTQGTYLDGYAMTLWIIERSSEFGSKYWRSVVNCSVSISETPSLPSIFNEVIRIRSIPTPQSRPTAWITPTVFALFGVLGFLIVPLYKGRLKGQRCLHCASWLVFINNMCIICICISCRLHPPPPKVYVDNGDPHQESTVDEGSDVDEDDSSESASDESNENDQTRTSVKNIKVRRSRGRR